MENLVNKSQNDHVDAQIEEFVTMILNARRLTHKNRNSESEQIYKEAERFAETHSLFAEAQIAQAAILQLNEEYEKAMSSFMQAANNPANHLKGWAWFFLGTAYRERYPVQKNANDEFSYKAIQYYENALLDESFDKKHWAKNNLANIFFRLGDSQRAKQYYKESLNVPDISRYVTYYNLGRLLLHDKLYEDSIDSFQKAINETGDDFDMRGACRREMGTAYFTNFLDNGIDVCKIAIECWEAARLDFDKHSSLTSNNATLSGKSAVALAKIRLARGVTIDNKNRLKSEDLVLLRWWPPDEVGPDGYSTPEERIFSKIESIGQDRYLSYNKKPSSRFSAFNNAEGCQMPAKNILSILRGWGSATPFIEDTSSACRGGGYFLKWRDKGVVIDPGLDFIHNFRANGFHMREIDVVVVTHDHTDHNFDLVALDDIFYEMNKRSMNANRHWQYKLICDENTASKDFLIDRLKHRRIRTIGSLDESPEKEFILDMTKDGLPFKFTFFRAKHTISPSYGLRIECVPENQSALSTKIGFSGDTEYYENYDQDEIDCDDLNKHLTDCDILVAHISQPSLSELVAANELKKNHLGYRGVAKLIKNVRPQLTLLGEFWAGYADMRIDLAKGLKRICDNLVIIPSSIGLFIDPERKEIECSNCKRWEPAFNVHVTSPSEDFGPLRYICSLCRMQP